MSLAAVASDMGGRRCLWPQADVLGKRRSAGIAFALGPSQVVITQTLAVAVCC